MTYRLTVTIRVYHLLRSGINSAKLSDHEAGVYGRAHAAGNSASYGDATIAGRWPWHERSKASTVGSFGAIAPTGSVTARFCARALGQFDYSWKVKREQSFRARHQLEKLENRS